MKIEKYICKIMVEKVGKAPHSEYLGIGRKIILKRILKEQGGTVFYFMSHQQEGDISAVINFRSPKTQHSL